MTPPKPPKGTAYDAAVALLARREHGSAELSQKLRTKGHPAADIAAAIARLQESGYLSDTRFAHARAGQRTRGSTWGKARIAQELTAKGVAKDAIAAALTDATQYQPEARAKLARKVANLPRDKAIAKLRRLGWPWADIQAILPGATPTEDLPPDDDDLA